jgi:hypothetical protein
VHALAIVRALTASQGQKQSKRDSHRCNHHPILNLDPKDPEAVNQEMGVWHRGTESFSRVTKSLRTLRYKYRVNMLCLWASAFFLTLWHFRGVDVRKSPRPRFSNRTVLGLQMLARRDGDQRSALIFCRTIHGPSRVLLLFIYLRNTKLVWTF